MLNFILLIAHLSLSAQTYVAVTNSRANVISLIRLNDPHLTTEIEAKVHPQDLEISSDKKTAYVLNMGSSQNPGHTISIVDLETRRIKDSIDIFPYVRPHWGVLSDDGKTLWVDCASKGSVLEIDVDKKEITSVYNTNSRGNYTFCFTPDEKKIITANFDDGSVSIIDRATRQPSIIKIGGKPIGIDCSPDGKNVWITSIETNTVTVLDLSTLKITNTFNCSCEVPNRLVFGASGEKVYVASGTSRSLTVFDVATKKIDYQIDVGGWAKGLEVFPTEKVAVITLPADGMIVVVDLEKKAVSGKIKVAEGPEGVEIY